MSENIRLRIMRGAEAVVDVPLWFIPRGAQFRECYETADEIVVCGEPPPAENDDSHNCDEMGCTTLSHVLYRFPKAKGGKR